MSRRGALIVVVISLGLIGLGLYHAFTHGFFMHGDP